LQVLPRRATLFALSAAVGILLSALIHPVIIRWALPLSLELRFVVTLLSILPLGFVMGIPFPSGLRVADEADARGIAAFWGANAVMSVVGSVLAMVLAVEFGFSAALLTGAVLYAAVAGIVRLTWQKMLI
jgi:hypothetical protein